MGAIAWDPVTTLTPVERQEQRQLIQAVRAVGESQMFGPSNELTLSMDPKTKKPIIRLVDRETKEVIRQMPPEYLLRLAEDTKA
jgi:flagellar protein FlaG